MEESIAVLLVDDHALLRDTLRTRLDAEPDIVVAGTAANADEAIAKAIRLKPDIILMDIDMPGQLAFSAAEQIKRQLDGTRIVFLSAFFHDRFIESALAARATGYVTKDEPPEVVIKAIRLAASGIAYFSPCVQSRLVVEADGVKIDTHARSRTSTLTARELEVLRYVARGLPKKEIGALMYISPKTVDRHTDNLMRKLNIHDRVQLTRFAIREGLAEA